jgi:hypothetical protein
MAEAYVVELLDDNNADKPLSRLKGLTARHHHWPFTAGVTR